jgi:hypothetical protein
MKSSAPNPPAPSRLRSRSLRAALAVVPALALAAGLSQAEAPAQVLPLHLRDTGLYTTGDRLAADLLPFAPQYPLWTDGAQKRRWIRLPPGTMIDASDPDRWVFPVGTQLWKEFSFGRPVETRYMERAADGAWRYGTYLWTEDGTDAVLAPGGAVVDLGDGRRHDVPSESDCVVCHDDGDPPVLGFSALQLSPDRDPGAVHAEASPEGVDLAELVAGGWVYGLPERLLSEPPRIPGDPTERAARGYLHGNCGGCHDMPGALAPLGMDLRHSVAEPDDAAVRTTVGRSSRAALPSDPAAPRVRIVPGQPEASVLLGRVSSRDPNHQMPPLGTRVVDREAVALLTRWISTIER